MPFVPFARVSPTCRHPNSDRWKALETLVRIGARPLRGALRQAQCKLLLNVETLEGPKKGPDSFSFHGDPKGIERDDFVDRALRDAGLPILHQKVQYAYSNQELGNKISQTLDH
ncbi:MAG: hypothetical protein A2735_03115 [Candidatus Yanofskybacteria bacterium RIFCSPHIGHO2_01_FULL_41_21]|uniref:Uncharacterized protein n=1 Tax=Candidatus Yanofskybacteria bacterium RIFCSPHIGHO2_01_FULL_41_21 TaxID=1802660 RepID=A0A1F8E940_9BACT|nr:MAG: hypothetical protein A2735_03115 [Candidatus Yanofskybacteria bacterium RIFCSPHIGHO2_01_FULL_41_21]